MTTEMKAKYSQSIYVTSRGNSWGLKASHTCPRIPAYAWFALAYAYSPPKTACLSHLSLHHSHHGKHCLIHFLHSAWVGSFPRTTIGPGNDGLTGVNVATWQLQGQRRSCWKQNLESGSLAEEPARPPRCYSPPSWWPSSRSRRAARTWWSTSARLSWTKRLATSVSSKR